MKPIDVKNDTYNEFGKELNDQDPQFKIDDHVRMSKEKVLKAILQNVLNK